MQLFEVIKVCDLRLNKSSFEVSVDNNMVEDFVLQANKEISKRTGMCTYIIETTAIKGYRKENTEIYEVMFMAVKKDGFSFGFSIVATFEVEGSKSRIVSLRSQPLDVQAPGFYEKQGYKRWGTLDGFPKNHKRHYYHKELGGSNA